MSIRRLAAAVRSASAAATRAAKAAPRATRNPRELTSHAFTEALQSREGYRVLGEDLNSWTQGGCWVLAEAIKKWVGPRAAPYVLLGQQESGRRGSPLLKMMGHHVVARVGDYYLDADGIDRGPERLINTWTEVEGLQNVSLKTFLPRYRKASLLDGLVCPADAVRRVAAFLEKKFGPGDVATAWMDGREVRPNPKRPAPPLTDQYIYNVLTEAVDSSRGMKLIGRAPVLGRYQLRIYEARIALHIGVLWLLFLGKELVGTGRLILDEKYAFARAGIAVIAKAYRRQGLYTAVLPILRKKLGVPIESDASMTPGAIGAWKRSGGKLTDRQGDKVFRIQNPAKRLYVGVYGSVWSMSPEAFERFLRAGATSRTWDLDQYGTRIARPAHRGSPSMFFVGKTLIYPLDWKTSEFEGALAEFLKHGKVVTF